MPRRILNLNGEEWQLGQAPPSAGSTLARRDELDHVSDWLPATVPGNIRADLMRAGRLPDLYFGTQAQSTRWVDDHHWWLIRDFDLPRSPDERVHLVLHGVDYVSDLFVNGRHLGRHEGMFSRQVHDISDLLQDNNRLAVRILGSRWLPASRSTLWEKCLNELEAHLGGLPGHFPHRRDTLKCQMSFGWDFAPPLRTMGIWDDVYAVVSSGVYIRDVTTRPQVGAGEAGIALTIELDAVRQDSYEIRCTVSGETFESEPTIVEHPIDLHPGPSRHSFEMWIPEPRLWWPWDHGLPDLYRLCLEVWQDGRLLDSERCTFGLRQIECQDWTLRVNGRPVYVRGANWVPADILPGGVGRADYEALLGQARQANMNMLRVWGGGLREKRAFYDLCDRLGMLVWQELPLACAFLTRYPRSQGFLQLLEAESRTIVRELRNHASLAIWCGGNEFSPRRNAPLVEVMAKVVDQRDPTRPFVPASPGPNDSHNWQVWHHGRPPQTYRRDTALFASEFGLQAPPRPATLQRFLPAEEVEAPGPAWVFHGAGLGKLERYARPFLPAGATSLEEWIEAGQRAQARGLQIAIEHYRRRKAQGGGGVLVWQLNEPWPAISWALIDYYRQPKPAYEMVRQLFNPILISLDYPLRHYGPGSLFCPKVWVINDSANTLANCHIEIALEGSAQTQIRRWTQNIDVSGNSAGIVGSFEWTLPASDSYRVTCRLAQDQRALSSNDYDLSHYDGIQPTLTQRARTWLTGLFMPG